MTLKEAFNFCCTVDKQEWLSLSTAQQKIIRAKLIEMGKEGVNLQWKQAVAEKQAQVTSGWDTGNTTNLTEALNYWEQKGTAIANLFVQAAYTNGMANTEEKVWLFGNLGEALEKKDMEKGLRHLSDALEFTTLEKLKSLVTKILESHPELQTAWTKLNKQWEAQEKEKIAKTNERYFGAKIIHSLWFVKEAPTSSFFAFSQDEMN
jgi:hypothetical protein